MRHEAVFIIWHNQKYSTSVSNEFEMSRQNKGMQLVPLVPVMGVADGCGQCPD